MMKLRKMPFFLGVLAILAVFGLVFTGCSSPTGSDGDGGEPSQPPVTKTPIASVALNVSAPAKGIAPSGTAHHVEAGNFTIGEVLWEPDHEVFLGKQVYTATVTLTAHDDYTFTGLGSVIINGQNWQILNNTGSTVTLSHAFAETDDRMVTHMVITSHPENLEYTHGDTLDLTGLVVTLTYDTGEVEAVHHTDFMEKNITISHSHGHQLVHGTHHEQSITITHGNHTIYTDALTVEKADGIFKAHAAIEVTYKNGLTLGAFDSQLQNGYVWTDPSVLVSNASNGQSFDATYTDPSGNFHPIDGTITVNVAKGSVSFPSHDEITVIYKPGLTLADLNAQLQGYCTWDAPTTSLYAGNGQSFAATYTDPSGNFNPANGTITVNVLQTVSPSIFEYYWINEHGSLVTTNNGAVTVNAGVTLAIMAQSDGYTVKQWRLNGIDTGQSGNSYNFSSVMAGNYAIGLFVEKDGKLYNTTIVITVDKVTIMYNINGGTGTTPVAQLVLVSSGTTLPNGTGFSKDSYTFGGWNTRVDGTGANYAAGSTYTPTGNITLYARWNYVVTFSLNSGSGTAPATQAVLPGSSIILPNGEGFSRNNYTFLDWSTTNIVGTGTNYNAGDNYTPTGNITLYARWMGNVTVNFNLNSGTGIAPTSQTVPGGSTIILPSGEGFSRNGYTFVGWNITPTGTETNYAVGASYTLISPTTPMTTTLYARWIANVTATFSLNNGTGIAPVSQTVPSGSTITLPSGDSFSRDGYTFMGWNTNSAGTGTNYAVGSSYTVNSTTTLYARWVVNYTVTFDLNGGVGTTPVVQTVPSGSTIILPSEEGFSRTGYTFMGWYANGTLYSVGGNYTVPTSNVTLYAQWCLILAENILADGNLFTSSTAEWYKFTATASTQYIHVDFGTLANLYVVVYDSDSNAVGTTAGTYLSDNARYTSRTLTAGQVYYMRVTPYTGRSGTYQIGFNTIRVSPGVAVLAENIWADGNLPLNGEQWFKFTATANMQYIHTKFDTLNAMYVQLYDSNLDAVYYQYGPEPLSINIIKPIDSSWTLIPDQVYYVQVTPFMSSSTGTYQITFNDMQEPPGFTSTMLTADTWIDGNLPLNGEQWFKFTATADPQYTHAIFGTLTDLYVQLYNSNGFKFGGESRLYSYTRYISRNVIVGQVYYIQVKAYDTGGTYRMAFSASAATPVQ